MVDMCKANGSNLLMLEQMIVHHSKRRIAVMDKLLENITKNVVVFAHHTDYLRALKEHFEQKFPDKKVFIIVGKISTKKRSEIIDYMEAHDNCILCASLTYDYFLKKQKSVSRFFDFQKYTNIFDIWLEDNPEFEIAKDYNRVFWALGYRSFETLFFKDPFITKPLENLIKNIHSEIDSYFTEREKEGLIITSEKLVLSFLDRHIGEIKDRYPDQDFALNFRAPSHISVRISSGVDEETASQLQEIARKVVESKENAETAEAIAQLSSLDGIDKELAAKLVAHGIKSGEDLADQATDDLTDIEGLDEKKAGD